MFRSTLSSSDNSSLGKTDSDSDYTEIEDCAHEDPNRKKKIEKLIKDKMLLLFSRSTRHESTWS